MNSCVIEWNEENIEWYCERTRWTCYKLIRFCSDLMCGAGSANWWNGLNEVRLDREELRTRISDIGCLSIGAVGLCACWIWTFGIMEPLEKRVDWDCWYCCATGCDGAKVDRGNKRWIEILTLKYKGLLSE